MTAGGSADPTRLRSLAAELRDLRHGDLATSGADALLDAAKRIVVGAVSAGAFGDYPEVTAAARAAACADVPVCRAENAEKTFLRLVSRLWQGEPRDTFGEVSQFAALGPIAEAIDTYADRAERGAVTGAQPQEPAGDEAAAPRPATSPPKNAWLAYYTREAGITKQTEIAATMTKHGVPAGQGQVSKWLKAVDAFLRAGGIAPTLEPLHDAPQAIDPSTLDMGERRDARTPRQRERRDPSDEWD